MENLVKLVVFVPEEHESALRQALADAGAGTIGNYDHVFFVSSGRGFFRPLEGARPFIGEVGSISEVRESRVETVCSRARLPSVLRAMRAVHPYEEIAFDVYPLLNHQL
jgi:hypothetical protein